MTDPELDAAETRYPQRGHSPASVTAPPRHPEPLPDPTGPAPYRLSLESLLPADEYAQIRDDDHLTFHMVGDVGGVHSPEIQLGVAGAMANDAHRAHDPARFLYLLGDVVYYNGEASKYYPQLPAVGASAVRRRGSAAVRRLRCRRVPEPAPRHDPRPVG